MTATPIPRTLYMALSGVRDISTINSPPEERLPVVTHIGPYSPKLVREAIIRELDRGGQVFSSIIAFSRSAPFITTCKTLCRKRALASGTVNCPRINCPRSCINSPAVRSTSCFPQRSLNPVWISPPTPTRLSLIGRIPLVWRSFISYAVVWVAARSVPTPTCSVTNAACLPPGRRRKAGSFGG